MRYHSVYQAVERAFSVAGYEAPIPTLSLDQLAGAEYDHSKKPTGDLTRLDWLTQNGMTLRLIRDALGGPASAQYLALAVRYCYEPATRMKSIHALNKMVPQRMERPKRLSVIAIWGGAIKMTYKEIDCGDGTKASTLGGHLREVRQQLDAWHNSAISHLSRVLFDAGLLEDAA